MDPDIWPYLALVAGLAALALATGFGRMVLAASPGSERMVELMTAIREGAMAFLRRMYSAVAVFVVIMLTGLWTLRQLMQFATALFESILPVAQ